MKPSHEHARLSEIDAAKKESSRLYNEHREILNMAGDALADIRPLAEKLIQRPRDLGIFMGCLAGHMSPTNCFRPGERSERVAALEEGFKIGHEASVAMLRVLLLQEPEVQP